VSLNCFTTITINFWSPAPTSSATGAGSLVDPRVDGDNEATRHVRIEVILIVWLGLTTLLLAEWVGLWIN
jgi:hypothetical protein